MEWHPFVFLYQSKFTFSKCIGFLCLLFLLSCNSEKSIIESNFAPGAAIQIPEHGLVVTALSADALNVTWSPSLVTGMQYKLLRSEELAGPYTEIYASSTATTFTDSGLTAGEDYFYKVEYHSGATVAETTPQQGIPIQGFSITSITPSSTRVDVVFPSVPGATSYSLRYGTASGVYGLEMPITSGAYVSGLTDGQTYYFQIRAKNSFGGVDSQSEVAVLVLPLDIQTLEFTTAFAPTTNSADASFSTQAILSAKNSSGGVVTTDSLSTVTLSAHGASGCTGAAISGGLGGTTTKTLSSGVATFTNIKAQKTSVRSIKATLGPRGIL